MPAAPKQSRTIIEKTTTVTETHMGYSPSPKKQAVEPKQTVIEETRSYSTLPPKKPLHEEEQRYAQYFVTWLHGLTEKGDELWHALYLQAGQEN